MIDTVRFTIDRPLPAEADARLLHGRRSLYDDGGRQRIGLFKNLLVRSRDGSFSVSGSLAVFANGDNLRPFDRAGVSWAIRAVADWLGVYEDDVRGGRVTRLDYGVNLDVPHAPGAYLRALGDPDRGTRRAYYAQTAEFGTKDFEVALYDKLAEDRRKRRYGLPRAEEHRGRNVLRVEARHRRRVKDQFDRVVRLGDLDDPGFYDGLKGRLRAAVDALPAGRAVIVGVPPRVARLKDDLAALGVGAAGGPDAVLAAIAEAKAAGAVDRGQAWRLRRGVNALLDASPAVGAADLAADLRRRVADATG